MPSYDFRILLETVEGKKTSYISQSFVDTDVRSEDLVLSSSQVYNRITQYSRFRFALGIKYSRYCFTWNGILFFYK